MLWIKKILSQIRQPFLKIHHARLFRLAYIPMAAVNFPSSSSISMPILGFGASGASGLFLLLRFAAIYPVKKAADEDDVDEDDLKLPKRLKRFRKFASIEYDGEIFMSPQDFLDSLTLDEPRERVFRTVIDGNQVKKMLKNTPPLRRGSQRMFRELGENGIISYAEYLFLITLLTKSQYSFNVAFIMFDEDDNMQIDKEEFLKIIYLLIVGTRQPTISSDIENDEYNPDAAQCQLDVDFRGDIPATGFFSNQQKDEAVKEMKQHDTTLTMHLFGRSGRDSLSFDQFQSFYEHLQRELIEIEFKEFSRGKDRISTVDFARLVLRYSILHKADQSPYIRRIYERSEYDDEGITLQQFETFSMFLNNLEDFSKAVRLYATADIPVSQTEFIRAVRCSTGFLLDKALVNVLFKIFDANEDDKLSYSEFIAVMSDRQSRGFKTQKQNTFGWSPFKDCLRIELSGSGGFKR